MEIKIFEFLIKQSMKLLNLTIFLLISPASLE